MYHIKGEKGLFKFEDCIEAPTQDLGEYIKKNKKKKRRLLTAT